MKRGDSGGEPRVLNIAWAVREIFSDKENHPNKSERTYWSRQKSPYKNLSISPPVFSACFNKLWALGSLSVFDLKVISVFDFIFQGATRLYNGLYYILYVLRIFLIYQNVIAFVCQGREETVLLILQATHSFVRKLITINRNFFDSCSIFNVSDLWYIFT